MKTTSMSVLFRLASVAWCGMLAAVSPASSEKHARAHAWTMEHGSLVSNWSFENELDTWSDSAANGVQVASREGSGFSPRSGRFFGKVTGNTSAATVTHLLKASRIPVMPGQSYTLSFYVVSDGQVDSGIGPAIRFFSDDTSLFDTRYGKSYADHADSLFGDSGFPDWTLYATTFTADSSTRFVEVALWGSVSAGRSARLGFDDVVLEEGALAYSTVSAHRVRHGYSVGYSDALGRTHQTQTRLPDGGYRVEAVVYDSVGRPKKTLMPFASSIASPAFIAAPLDSANAYYDGAPAPDAGGYAYSEVEYADEPASRVVKGAAPGQPWRLSGAKVTEAGFHFTNSLGIPGGIKNPVMDAGEREYRLDWSRNEDSVFVLSWTNRKGQVVQSAQQADGSAWAITKTDYYPSGRVRRVRTPLDTSGAFFSEVSNYDAQGLLTSSFGPDRGLVKFRYNRQGMIRYSQSEAQRAKDSTLVSYTDYDALGNPVSSGEQFVSLDVLGIADGNGGGGADGKIEGKGWLYGSLDDFESRSGVPLDSIPNSSSIARGWRAGALMAAWNRNLDSRAPGLSEREKFVADFYEYDDHGNVAKRHKYMGAMREHSLQTSEYVYDESDRLIGRGAYQDGNSMDMLMDQSYAYDAMGRVSSITALGDTVARYGYFGHGPMASVGLGRDGGKPGTVVSYDYHMRGWMRRIGVERGGNGDKTYEQALGYETRALEESGMPALSQSSHTGHITQQLYKFTSDVPNPVRAVNYVYDRMGRLTTADYRHASNLDSTGALAFPLSFADADDLDTRVAYDQNGRILGKRSGGVSSADSAVYGYHDGSYRIGNISGRLSSQGARDASRAGNFAYDADGRMTQDLSKGLRAEYGNDGMPVEFSVRHGREEVVLHPLYDAMGQRVSQLSAKRPARGFPVYWVGRREGGEPEGLYTAPSIEAALANADSMLNTLGYPAPDTLVLYVVPDSGENGVEPAAGEYKPLMKGSTVVPVLIHGVLKPGTGYSAVMEDRGGALHQARHWVGMGGSVTSEVAETFDSSGALRARRIIANIHGRGEPIGRVVSLGGTPVVQFFIKNHLGSTVRVVNADGSYATTPTFDYQPYGELQSIREDSANPVSQLYTGKPLDTEVNLYYFGARWYDQELGMWLTPDPKAQYPNPYSYGNGMVLIGVDEDGNWFIIDDIIVAAVGAVVGAGIAISKGYDPFDAQFWGYTAGGAAIGWAAYATGGAAAGALGGGFWATVAGGAVAGGITGAGNYTLESGIETGFNDFSTTDFLQQTATGAITGAVTAGVLKGGAMMYENYTGKDPMVALADKLGNKGVPIEVGNPAKEGVQPTWSNIGTSGKIGVTQKMANTLVGAFSATQASVLASSVVAGPKHELIGLSAPFYERQARKIIEKADRTLCEVWDHSSCDYPPSNEPLPSPGPMY